MEQEQLQKKISSQDVYMERDSVKSRTHNQPLPGNEMIEKAFNSNHLTGFKKIIKNDPKARIDKDSNFIEY